MPRIFLIWSLSIIPMRQLPTFASEAISIIAFAAIPTSVCTYFSSAVSLFASITMNAFGSSPFMWPFFPIWFYL